MDHGDPTTFFTILNQTVEEHGCRIESVDFEDHIINLKGPQKAVEACAKALASLLD